jgi:hypothetical protein
MSETNRMKKTKSPKSDGDKIRDRREVIDDSIDNISSKMLYNKYECLSDEHISKIIQSSNTLLILLYSLLRTDIIEGADVNIEIYVSVLVTLIKNDNMNANLKKSEIELLLHKKPSYLLKLAESKYVPIEYIKKHVNDVDLSIALTEVCVNQLNTSPYSYPVTYVQFMISNNIQFDVNQIDDILFSSLVNICPSRDNYSRYDVVSNMFVGNIEIPSNKFTNGTSAATLDIFFASDTFYKNFETYSTEGIKYVGSRINKTKIGSEYKNFIKYEINNNKFHDELFIDKFVQLLSVIQTTILNDSYHLYTVDYDILLQIATPAQLILLNFHTLILLNIAHNSMFKEHIESVLQRTALRDGISVTILKKWLDRSDELGKDYGAELINVLKNIVVYKKCKYVEYDTIVQGINIDLLILLLEKKLLTENDVANIASGVNIITDNENNSVALKMLACDVNIVKICLKIFKGCLTSSINSNLVNFSKQLDFAKATNDEHAIELFRAQTEYIKSISSYATRDNSISTKINILCTLFKLNECAKYECNICNTYLSSISYSCGHIICEQCHLRSSDRYTCPYCNVYSTAKKIFI